MPESVKDHLVAAFRYLLKPIVRLAIKNGVSFPEFSEALKQAYVDVAARQLRTSGKDRTEEEISLMTSVQTTDIRNILRSDSGAKFKVAAEQANPLATLLAGWHTDVRYTGPYGVLRDLPFSAGESTPSLRSGFSDVDQARESSTTSFSDLAEKYCPGISPRALINELVRTGCVQEVGTGFYRAIKRSYVPDPLSTQNILLFARVVHNVCESAEVNLRPESADAQGLMERTVYTVHGITKKELKDFDKFIRVRGQAFADDIDNWLSDRDREGAEDSVKTGIGFYHYIVNEDDELALSKQVPS
jgi:hypothetical protein